MGLVGAGLLRAARRRVRRARTGSPAIGVAVVGTLYGAVIELVVDPAAVQRATRDRAGRDDRRRPALRWPSSPRYPRSTDDGAPVPAGRRPRRGRRRRRPDHRRAARDPRRGAARRARARRGSSTARRSARRSRRRPRTPTSRACRASTRRWCRPSVWAIAGFLATLSMIADRRRRRVRGQTRALGPNTLVRALAAAVIAGMVSFPRACSPASPSASSQVARSASTSSTSPGSSTSCCSSPCSSRCAARAARGRGGDADVLVHAQGARPIPERLRDDLVGARSSNVIVLVRAPSLRSSLPLVVTPAVAPRCSTPSIAVLRHLRAVAHGPHRLGGQLSLGQMAFAGIGALLAAAFTRGLDDSTVGSRRTCDLEPHAVRACRSCSPRCSPPASRRSSARRAPRPRPAARGHDVRVRASPRSSTSTTSRVLTDGSHDRAVPAGIALRPRPRRRSAPTTTWSSPCSSSRSSSCRLRRSGIGRTTIAVRDNADARPAYTVGEHATKLRAFALAGGIAGLGGALLAGASQAVPFTDRYFLVGGLAHARVDRGDRRPRARRGRGPRRRVGRSACPRSSPTTTLVPLLTSSLGLLVLLLYFPGGLRADRLLGRATRCSRGRRRSAKPPPTEQRVADTAGAATARRGRRSPTDVPALRGRGHHACASAASSRSTASSLERRRRRDRRAHRHERRRQVDADERHRRLRAVHAARSSCSATTCRGTVRARPGPRSASGARSRPRALFPELTVRETVEVALEARGRTGLLSTALFLPALDRARAAPARRGRRAHRLPRPRPLRRQPHRRPLDRHPPHRRARRPARARRPGAVPRRADRRRRQRETEAFGPLIMEIRRELGAVDARHRARHAAHHEHQRPRLLPRARHASSPRASADASATTRRSIASYLGTDERAIARSGAANTAVHPRIGPRSSTLIPKTSE